MELNIRAGDEIRYTSAIGTRLAVVESIRIAPTAKPNHSIPWLDLRVFGHGSQIVSIPADTNSLKMFKVEMA